MATAHQVQRESRVRTLHNGDRMNRREFHVAYCQMPESYKAELIGGIVFEPSPLGWSHGTSHVSLGSLLHRYAIRTPGVEVGDNASVFLSDEDEVQPDLVLRTVQMCGGTSRLTDDDYVEGPPELVAEVASSSRAIDLHLKKERYALAGVREYIVLCLCPKQLYWFDLQRQVELKPDKNGIFRSVIFPGLWIHGEGLLQGEHELTARALDRGLRSADHKRFVCQLKRKREK
ncbi:MAG TPA: Uma2 family endonuclease [Candidatus Obscuribacterales bacterium]